MSFMLHIHRLHENGHQLFRTRTLEFSNPREETVVQETEYVKFHENSFSYVSIPSGVAT